MLKIQFSRKLCQPFLIEGQITRGHGIGVDPGPDRVRVPPPILFVEDYSTGLSFQPEALFSHFHGGLEYLYRYGFLLWRV